MRTIYLEGRFNAAGTLLGHTEDGRRVVVAPALPAVLWTESQLAAIGVALAADPGLGVVVAIDGATGAAWAAMPVSEKLKLVSQLCELTAQSPQNEVWAVHGPGTPPPDLDPALVYLLRSSGFEVRPLQL